MTPQKKSKLQSLLSIVRGEDETLMEGFKAFDDGVAELKKNLEKGIKANTLEEVNVKLSGFQKKIDFTPLLESFETLKQELANRDTEYGNELQNQLETKIEEVKTLVSETEGKIDDRIIDILKEGVLLQSQIDKIGSRKFPEFPDFLTPIQEVETRLMEVITTVQADVADRDKTEELRRLIKKLEESLTTLRSQISNLGGGNANRQILFNGTDYLTQYTDINYKAGANVTFTISNNQTTKKVDVTIAASASGGGLVRSINSVAIDTAAGATVDTDYVYIATSALTLTLPNAISNENLYTAKNTSNGTLTIATTGGQTIDGDLTITLPVQYTSVDLISDGANWHVT